jgi:hypothetical protein
MLPAMPMEQWWKSLSAIDPLKSRRATSNASTLWQQARDWARWLWTGRLLWVCTLAYGAGPLASYTQAVIGMGIAFWLHLRHRRALQSQKKAEEAAAEAKEAVEVEEAAPKQQAAEEAKAAEEANCKEALEDSHASQRRVLEQRLRRAERQVRQEQRTRRRSARCSEETACRLAAQEAEQIAQIRRTADATAAHEAYERARAHIQQQRSNQSLLPSCAKRCNHHSDRFIPQRSAMDLDVFDFELRRTDGSDDNVAAASPASEECMPRPPIQTGAAPSRTAALLPCAR